MPESMKLPPSLRGLTGWIEGDPLADRPGWYEVKFGCTGLVRRRFWSGVRWTLQKNGSGALIGPQFGDQFRGLLAPAKD